MDEKYNAEVEDDQLLDFQMNVMNDFNLKESSSSCYLEDIESFTYGPFTSRFWMLRKHILLMDKKKFASDPPFYAWDCITLQVKNKWNVHLIIRCEKTMEKFIKLLIHHIQTINGQRLTSVNVKEQIFKRVIKNIKKRGNSIDNKKEEEIRKQIEHDIMCQVFTRYNIMRVRMKLSFSCFIKNMPLNELWMTQILNSFKYLQRTNQIPAIYLSKEED